MVDKTFSRMEKLKDDIATGIVALETLSYDVGGVDIVAIFHDWETLNMANQTAIINRMSSLDFKAID